MVPAEMAPAHAQGTRIASAWCQRISAVVSSGSLMSEFLPFALVRSIPPCRLAGMPADDRHAAHHFALSA